MANPILTRQFGESTAEDLRPPPPASPQASAGNSSWNVMTKTSVTLATLFLLALVAMGAILGWQNADWVVGWWWLILPSLIALVVVAIFVPRLALAAGVIYSVASGALLGALSKEFEALYDGIVFLALTATVVVFVVALLLYLTGVIKVTQRLRATVLVAACGVTLFYLTTLVMSWFGLDVPLVTGAGPGAIAFSLLVILIVSLGLMLDFDTIERGIATGAPRRLSEFAAFGLITSIVWVYIEILRLLAILAWRSI